MGGERLAQSKSDPLSIAFRGLFRAFSANMTSSKLLTLGKTKENFPFALT